MHSTAARSNFSWFACSLFFFCLFEQKELQGPFLRLVNGRAVVKSTFVESKTSPSPKRFESESRPSPKRFESESSQSPKRFESKTSPSPKRFESESRPSPKRFESKSSPIPNETVKTDKEKNLLQNHILNY